MKVRTRLYLSTTLIICLAVGFFFAVRIASSRIRLASEEHEFARGIQESVSQLNLVLYEYLLSYKPRARDQWRLKYQSIQRALGDARAKGSFGNLLSVIDEQFSSLERLFEMVVQNAEHRSRFVQAKLGSLELMGVTLEREDQILEQLVIRSQSLIHDASRVAQASHARLQEVQSEMDKFILGFVLFVICGVGASSSAVVRSISKPIRKLMTGVEAFGRGHLDHRIALRSKDELGQLAGAFDQMSSALQNKIEALDRTNKELRQKNEQIREELELATQIQKTLIPAPVHTDHADIAVDYLPFSFMGGDYAKFHFVDRDRLVFIISDVTGHGVGAALLVNRLHAEFEHLAREGKEPGTLLKELNDFITGSFDGTYMYLSAFCGCLDFHSKVFRYSNYGHPPQYMYHATKKCVDPLQSQTTLLGLSLGRDGMFEQEIPFDWGDKIILFTDGIIEARNGDGEIFGCARVQDVLARNFELRAADLNRRLLEELDRFKRGDFTDDVFLLTIEINAPSEGL